MLLDIVYSTYSSDEDYSDEEETIKVPVFQPMSTKFKKMEEKRAKEEKQRKKKSTLAEMEAKEFREQKKAELEAVKSQMIYGVATFFPSLFCSW